MDRPTYIVDGNALVDNIHFIKQCVYDGLFSIHIPECATETAEKLHQKSLEPKETPKNDKPKRWSGRPRREQQPLFDINPRTTTEFLERIRSEKGVPRATLQSEGEKFTQWREVQEAAAAKIEGKPPAKPRPFQEALLRKLNIKEADETTDDAPGKPELVAKPANGTQSSSKHQTTPSITLSNIPHGLQALFSCVLWRLHEYEHSSLNPEKYVLLLQDQAGLALARSIQIPVITPPDLRASIARQLLSMDNRGVAGELEEEFPDAPKRETPLRRTAPGQEVLATANGSNGVADEAERALEAVALSVVQGLDQPDSLDVESERQLTKILAAELRPSISYAMAAGSTPATPKKPASSSSQQQRQQQQQTVDAASQPIAPLQTSQPVTTDEASKSPVKASAAVDDEVDSDEDVVVFNPKARQAAQANKKRRSREVSKSTSRPVSRPTTATTAATAIESAVQPNSPRLTSAILNSVLKPQSPVFSPRQMYVASSPVMQTSSLASPGLVPTAVDVAVSPASPLQRTVAASPQPGTAKQPPNGPRNGHASGQNRPVNQEAMQRQSELILQRQREAIKRSAQVQDNGNKANRSPKDAAGKAPPREVEMRPTDNPVVIDPDDFGRDYTIKPAPVNDNHGGRARGEGRGGGKRGGRGRSKPQQPEGARGADVDFVLKSGNPRGAARGKGKLWVP